MHDIGPGPIIMASVINETAAYPGLEWGSRQAQAAVAPLYPGSYNLAQRAVRQHVAVAATRSLQVHVRVSRPIVALVVIHLLDMAGAPFGARAIPARAAGGAGARPEHAMGGHPNFPISLPPAHFKELPGRGRKQAATYSKVLEPRQPGTAAHSQGSYPVAK
jgi:hypothetical protein